RALRFFAPAIEQFDFPAWDCVPYDRVSPHAGIVAQRMATLSGLAARSAGPAVVLTTINAVLQRTPTTDFVKQGSLAAVAGRQVRMADLVEWLERNGFLRSANVREPGEYAVRGGILDLFAAGAETPVRLDF